MVNGGLAVAFARTDGVPPGCQADLCDTQNAACHRHVRAGVLRPVAAGPMADDDALNIALRLKALADPARVQR